MLRRVNKLESSEEEISRPLVKFMGWGNDGIKKSDGKTSFGVQLNMLRIRGRCINVPPENSMLTLYVFTANVQKLNSRKG